MAVWDVIYSREEKHYAKGYGGGKYRAVVVYNNGEVFWEFNDTGPGESFGMMSGGWADSVQDAFDECDEYYKDVIK